MHICVYTTYLHTRTHTHILPYHLQGETNDVMIIGEENVIGEPNSNYTIVAFHLKLFAMT